MMRGALMRTVSLGVRSLLLHKLRSVLTTLGVLFGVSSVIAMLAIGEGASEEAQEAIRQLGSQNVILRSVKPPEDKVSNQESRVLSYGLTHEDRARAAETYPGVKDVVAVLEVPEEVRFGSLSCRPRVLCVDPTYKEVTGRIMMEGRFLTGRDGQATASVCVLGYEVARYLFPFKPAIGERIKVGAEYFHVVGVMYPRVPIGSIKRDPGTEVGGEVFIPIKTGQRLFGERQVKIRSGGMDAQEVQLHEIIIAVEHDQDVPMIANASRLMLTDSHREKDYEVIVPLELLLRAQETKRIFSIVLASIAGISLLVGGIGIIKGLPASPLRWRGRRA